MRWWVLRGLAYGIGLIGGVGSVAYAQTPAESLLGADGKPRWEKECEQLNGTYEIHSSVPNRLDFSNSWLAKYVPLGAEQWKRVNRMQVQLEMGRMQLRFWNEPQQVQPAKVCHWVGKDSEFWVNQLNAARCETALQEPQASVLLHQGRQYVCKNGVLKDPHQSKGEQKIKTFGTSLVWLWDESGVSSSCSYALSWCIQELGAMPMPASGVSRFERIE